MSLLGQFAIRNELLYSGFVLPNVQIFFVQKISFATFGVSIDDFFTRYAGLGYSLYPDSRTSLVSTRDIQAVDNSERVVASRISLGIKLNSIS